MIVNSKKIVQAEEMRYARIQQLIDLLFHKSKNMPEDFVEEEIQESFPVGMKIKVDGNKIRVRNREYSSVELQKVTINTEGTMAIYDRDGKKLCGSIWLNSSTKNIELFCVWVRKYHVPAEVVSGKGEKVLQMLILVFAVAALFFYKLLMVLNR